MPCHHCNMVHEGRCTAETNSLMTYRQAMELANQDRCVARRLEWLKRETSFSWGPWVTREGCDDPQYADPDNKCALWKHTPSGQEIFLPTQDELAAEDWFEVTDAARLALRAGSTDSDLTVQR